MILGEYMVFKSDIVLIISILVQNYIVCVFFIKLLQERKPTLLIFVLFPRDIFGYVIVPKRVQVNFLITKDLVFNLGHNLVNVELVIIVELIVPVLIEFD
jgi:hypothetical protein